jgi:hypothetical protein
VHFTFFFLLYNFPEQDTYLLSAVFKHNNCLTDVKIPAIYFAYVLSTETDVYKNTQHTVITEQQIKMLVAKSF